MVPKFPRKSFQKIRKLLNFRRKANSSTRNLENSERKTRMERKFPLGNFFITHPKCPRREIYVNHPRDTCLLLEDIHETLNLTYYYFRVTLSRSYLAPKCGPNTTMDKYARCPPFLFLQFQFQDFVRINLPSSY